VLLITRKLINKITLSIFQSFLGDYCGEVHLFPFRTEKLSSPAQMVLAKSRESMSSPIFRKPF
jgi:hypothetical protein